MAPHQVNPRLNFLHVNVQNQPAHPLPAQLSSPFGTSSPDTDDLITAVDILAENQSQMQQAIHQSINLAANQTHIQQAIHQSMQELAIRQQVTNLQSQHLRQQLGDQLAADPINRLADTVLDLIASPKAPSPAVAMNHASTDAQAAYLQQIAAQSVQDAQRPNTIDRISQAVQQVAPDGQYQPRVAGITDLSNIATNPNPVIMQQVVQNAPHALGKNPLLTKTVQIPKPPRVDCGRNSLGGEGVGLSDQHIS